MSEFEIALPLWAGAAMLAVGVLGAFYFLVVERMITAGERAENEVEKKPAPSRNSGAAFILVCLVTVGLLAAILSSDFPDYEWRHPTLPTSEQKMIIAECEMQALEKVGPGDLDPELSGRAQYMDACLRAQDFKRERIEEGGGE